MYHIKNDKRCIRSAEKIGAALRELLLVKPLTDITVTDIQKVSGTGRSTFYRLFDNIDDVLLYYAEEEFDGMLDLYRRLSLQEFTVRLIEAVVMESREIINIASSGKTYLISKALRTGLTSEARKSHYVFDDLSRNMIAMFVGGCLSLVTAWDENGRQESIEELAGLMARTFNFKEIEATLTRPVADDAASSGRLLQKE